MNPFDDILPEEQESQYRELIELVQKAPRNPLPAISADRESIIAHVRQRLAEQVSAADYAEGFEQYTEKPNLPFGEHRREKRGLLRLLSAALLERPAVLPQRKKQGRRLLSVLAAVLGVCILIGASFLLFESAPENVNSLSMSVEAQGLELTMSVTAGPYFLGELIEVSMTLSNHSTKTYLLFGESGGTICNAPLRATLTGGGSPHFTLFNEDPVPIMCPHMSAGDPFEPGQVVSVPHQYIALTNSGQQKLTVQLARRLNLSSVNPLDPFKDHPLALTLNVAPRVPAGRNVLSLQQRGSTVAILAPPSLHSSLAYMDSVKCQNARGEIIETMGPAFSWILLGDSLSINVFKENLCAGETSVFHAHWRLVVGAVGYALVVGEFFI